jgi:ZIP family zinc transporter
MQLNNDSFALLLSLAAGLCTGFGGIAAVAARQNARRLLPFSLGFAAGVMIMVSLADILPEATAFIERGVRQGAAGVCALLAIIFGMLLAALGSNALPDETGWIEPVQGAPPGIAKVGIVTMAAVVAHNIPEGVATYMAGCGERSLGISVAAAIALHNIPEGISVAIPVFYATRSKGKGFLCALISGFGEPLGALLAWIVLRPFLTSLSLGVILGIVAGIMLFVSFNELIPAALRYGKRTPIVGIMLGLVVMGIGLAMFSQ